MVDCLFAPVLSVADILQVRAIDLRRPVTARKLSQCVHVCVSTCVCVYMCRLPNSDPVPVPPPPVKWAQRPDVVLITIPLGDITEEQLSVSEHKLSIRWVGGEERGE